MTIRRAIIFYLVSVLVAVAAAWFLAYFVAWWVGMVLLTVVIADHIRYTVKRIKQNKP